MLCACIQEMDAQLRDHNTRLCVTFGFPRDGSPSFVRAALMCEKIEPRKRGKSVLVVPTFCPFCGDRYEPAPAVAQSAGGMETPFSSTTASTRAVQMPSDPASPADTQEGRS